jgi:hypothetical protein
MFPESEARNRSKPAGPASRLRLIGWKSLPLIGSGLVGPNSKSHEARVQPEVMSVDLFFSHETFLAVPESGFRVRCQRLFRRVAKGGAVAMALLGVSSCASASRALVLSLSGLAPKGTVSVSTEQKEEVYRRSPGKDFSSAQAAPR